MRAVAVGAAHVTMLCGPQGAPAADLLPGIDRVRVWAAPWVTETARPIDDALLAEFRALIAEEQPDEAVVLTSFHQSPLPLALLLRLAGVPRVSGASVDHPGSLLHVDVKKLGNVPDGGGWRYLGRQRGNRNRAATAARTGQRSAGRGALVGTAYVHTVIDDHSRVAYAEVHDDETAATAIGVLRRAVFVKEQGVPEALEWDEHDATALHVVALNGLGRAVATARLVAQAPGVGRVGRMAVDRALRGGGHGATVLRALEEAARARGDHDIVLHAQRSAQSFYAALGYVPHGEPFEEAGIALDPPSGATAA